MIKRMIFDVHTHNTHTHTQSFPASQPRATYRYRHYTLQSYFHLVWVNTNTLTYDLD